MDEHLNKDDDELTEVERAAKLRQLESAARNEGMRRAAATREVLHPTTSSPSLAEMEMRRKAEERTAREKRAAQTQLRFKNGLRLTLAAIPLLVALWMIIWSVKLSDEMSKPIAKTDIPSQFYVAIACGLVGGLIFAYATWQNRREEKEFRRRFPN